MVPVVSIVGKSRSGKTTLMEKIIPELKKRGYRVGVIKHAGHGFDVDQKGKDSWRHGNAGADTVAVAGAENLALMKKGPIPGLDSLLPYFEDVDLVITEGYKHESKPKIEVFRSAAHEKPLCLGQGDLIAWVSDVAPETRVPRFGLEDIQEIVDFIEQTFLTPGHSRKEKP
ncbi:MAG: molybdopterin-guanine dinucleotide biosynthesis protein B [Desulfobacteraceae bacterium]|nr:molybdopterin-guanine dinucleotide biosynthesis protein B [Desulfobacteraceae bacterium]MBU4002325.1 molybdopterin-guanine dinucleotide biosynthesis protein B [Pseudomonadota bacterium]MBU4054706.1 molybdopterin-guanine dinucleotide biosynthesis protein B [Pseudomonadota bacterium]